MESVRDWLRVRQLGQYADLFEREAIDFDALGRLTDENLKDLGLPLGHRLKLLDAIKGRAETRAHVEVQARIERRQLTVMFCDLVGSTGLAERLDPEELRDLMSAYQACVARVISRYEGHVAQYLGDGVMAYFGWPSAHEDDAERSVRAAQEIVAAVKNVSSRNPLRVRVGIATGQVVVGETGLGDASVPKMAVGETPNVAARVQAHADPDEVLLAGPTRRLVAARFDFDDAGERALKGLAEPVHLWRLRGENRDVDRLGVGRPAAMVGRESELALLFERWTQAAEGEGQVVLLCGEPGVGKSRIAYALRERVDGQPHHWIQWQCSSFFSNTALHPVIEQMRRAAGIVDADPPEEKLAKLERFIDRVGGADREARGLLAALLSLPVDERHPALAVSAERRKQLTIEAFVAQLERASRVVPVMLAVEDAHWVDPTTRELIDHLVPRVPLARLLVLITHRPEFDPPWGGHTHVTAHSLNRLSRRQCAHLATQLAGKLLPEPLLAHIVEKTDGVPLFVEELTKAVLESGLLVQREDGYELRGTLESLRVPATLHDSLMARLDRLAAAKEVAQTGAVIGREFDHELLAAVAPLDAGALDAALEGIVRSGLVYRRAIGPKQLYVFKHALVQEAAYDSLLRARRAELHMRIAEVLETRETSPEVTARHFTSAGLAARALPYWRKAGQRALERAANREAAGHFRRALDLLDDIPASPHRGALDLSLLIELGEAQMRCGESFEPMKTFERAAAMAVTLSDAEGLAHAARGYAEASWRPGLNNPASVRLLQRANAALGERADLLKAQVLASLVLQLGMAGAHDAARRVRLEAQALAVQLGEPRLLTVTLYRALVVNGWHPEIIGELRAATGRLPELIEQSLLADDEHAVLDLLPSGIAGNAWLGDVPAAERMLEQYYVPLARKHGQPFYVYYARSSRAAFALFAGRFAESEQWARDALELGQGMQGFDAAGMYGVQMFSLRREQGRLREVAPILRNFVDTVARESTWRPALALVYAELGMLPEARRELEDVAREGFAAVPEDITWINCMGMLAETCAAVGDAANAALLRERLLPFAGCNVVAAPTVALYGAVDRYLALLAATLGRWEEAERSFERALEANERQGGRPSAATTRYQYAAALREHGVAADRPRVRELAGAALATARELDMRSLGERCERLLQGCA
jgi:class 3 adenylate cyclase